MISERGFNFWIVCVKRIHVSVLLQQSLMLFFTYYRLVSRVQIKKNKNMPLYTNAAQTWFDDDNNSIGK